MRAVSRVPVGILAVAAIAVAACQPVVRLGGGDVEGTDTDSSTETSTETGSDTGTYCAEQNFSIELVPPRIMILLDRSASMNDEVTGFTDTKWDQATAAIENIVQTYYYDFLFGFDAFPSSGNCDVDGPILVDVGETTAGNQDVITALYGTTADGASTPLYCGMEILGDPSYAPGLNDPAASKYMVVVSDGADLCGEGCCTALNPIAHPECVATNSEFAQMVSGLVDDADIRVFAISFDAENVSETQLNAIASNGGTGQDEFFDATDQTSLEDVFDIIAQEVISCVYALEDPGDAADPDVVNFYFVIDGDEEVVPHDEGCVQGLGWTWTDSSHEAVEFCAEACDQLKSGDVVGISARFGCPTVVVE